MDPATKSVAVDWAAVGNFFEKRGASKKGDGSNRTLAGLVPGSDTVTFVREAIGGTGSSSGSPDPVRRQRVDEGISVVLAEKMDEELAAARTKIAAKNLDAGAGAPHNVTRRGPSSSPRATVSPPPPKSGRPTSLATAR